MADEQSTVLGPFHVPTLSLSPIASVAVAAGQPCGPSASLPDGQVRLCQANSQAASIVQGLAVRAAAANEHVLLQYGGLLTLETAQWDAIAGTSGGLAKDTLYYVSPTTAGHITSTAPSAGGQFIQAVGFAVSAKSLMIAFNRPTDASSG